MKDSTGWYLCWSSCYLDIPVERIAINAKVMSANQDNTNKMVAASAGNLVRLWSIADAGESREIGKDLSAFYLPSYATVLQIRCHSAVDKKE